MAEKVLFEIIATESKGNCKIEIRQGTESYTIHNCNKDNNGAPCFAWVNIGTPPKRNIKRSQRHFRRSLDTLERLYEDLYGGPKQSEL